MENAVKASPASQLVAQSKRKEKARIAARARRGQEASIIMEMADELNITQEKLRRIDKATIVKLAIDYIKAFEILCRFRSICAQNQTQIASTSDVSDSERDSSSSTSTTCNRNTSTTCCVSKKSVCSLTSTTQLPPTQPASAIDNDENNNTNNNDKNHDKVSNNNNNHTEREPQSHHQPKRPRQPQQAEPAMYSMPKLSTKSIFAPKTDDMDSHFLIINERDGRPAFILKPDTEILDDDDLTHLAPQAGDTSIPLEVEPLEGIVLDTSLFVSGSPPTKRAPIMLDGPKELRSMGACCSVESAVYV